MTLTATAVSLVKRRRRRRGTSGTESGSTDPEGMFQEWQEAWLVPWDSPNVSTTTLVAEVTLRVVGPDGILASTPPHTPTTMRASWCDDFGQRERVSFFCSLLSSGP